MPTLKESPKPSAKLRYGFKAEAERTALHYRKELNLDEFAPLPAVALAKHMGVRIMTPYEIPGITDDLIELLLNGKGKDIWSAAIFVKNQARHIIHNPTHSSARQESNLMHELAHASCNHELAEMETALSGLVLPLRKYDHNQEAEAEYLGGCLQLPQKALFHYYHKLKKNNDEIALAFNASKQMVAFRLRITGVPKIKFSR
jgi:hypothetical protein